MTEMHHPREVFDLTGHEAAEEAFEATRARGRLHHAWLLTGPEGAGKATFAYRAARRLLGAPPDPAHGVLGANPDHPVSRQIIARSHPDLFVLERVGEDGKVRKVIPVDEARGLSEFFSKSPASAPHRVAIIDAVDDLNTNAANAILKTLEEPPPHGVLLMVSHSPGRLLPTIRSRCRLVTLTTPSADEVAGFLTRVEGIDPALASYCARASQGHIGRARALARDEGARHRRKEVVSMPAGLTSLAACMNAAQNLVETTQEEADLITGALDARERADLDTSYGVVERGRRPREYAPAAAALERAQKTRAKRRHLDVVDRGLMDLVSVYRDAIAVATGGGGTLVNEEIRHDIDQLVRTSSPELNLRRIGWIFDAREQMLEFNVPVPLALESLMVSLKMPAR